MQNYAIKELYPPPPPFSKVTGQYAVHIGAGGGVQLFYDLLHFSSYPTNLLPHTIG